MKKILKYLDINFYNLLIVFLILLNIAPILAPVLAALNLIPLAQIIYFVYSFFCHQLDWRSLHVLDFQYAWCVRDTFIWLNILVVGLLTKRYKIKPLNWYWLIPFMIPIALDGGIQTVATVLGYISTEPLYMSTDLMRMLTGTIFGLGFGLWIMPNMWEAGYFIDKRKDLPIKQLRLGLIAVVLNMVLYVFMVMVWDLTSSKYNPSNFLDYAAKTPSYTYEWLIRRAHGV